MWIRSFKMILRQQWLTYTLLFGIGFIGALVAYITSPGEEGIQALLEMADNLFIQTIFGDISTWDIHKSNIGSENPDFYLYFVFLYFITYMVNVYPVAGIWLGGAGITEEVNSGMADIFIASPHRKEKIITRHLITHLILLTFFTLLIYLLIPMSFDLLGAKINYSRLFSAFILLWISGITFFSITFFLISITLRSDLSRGITGLIFLLSYLINLLMSMNPNYEGLKYLNLLHYTNPRSILLLGDTLEFDNYFPLLSIFLLALGAYVFISRDPIPLQIDLKEKYTNFRNKIVIRDYIQPIFQKLSPISAEQWIADRMIFIIFFVFCFFGALSIIFGFPTGEGGFAEMSQIYRNNPLVKAILRDSLDLIIDDPLGPIYPQFYGYTWLYFFPFVIIGAGRIVSREKNDKTIDLILGTPVKPRTLILYRILTVVIELAILTSMTLLLIIIGEFYLEIESKLLEQFLTLIIIPFVYGTILCFLIAISLVFPSPDNRKKITYSLGALTVLFVTLPYFSEPLMPLRFLSPLYYMDLVGLIVHGYQWEHVSLLLVLVGILIVSLVIIHRSSDKTPYV